MIETNFHSQGIYCLLGRDEKGAKIFKNHEIR